MGTIISDCGCCTIFTVRSCCDTDVTPPSALTLSLGYGTCAAMQGEQVDNDLPFPQSTTACANSTGTWTIPLTQVAPPAGTNFSYCYVNASANYYGGHFPEQAAINIPIYGAPFFADSQGYVRVANPLAGCTANYCTSDLYTNGQYTYLQSPYFGDFFAWYNDHNAPLTIAGSFGVSVFLGICPGGNPSVMFLSFLDLDTPHIDSCQCVDFDCGTIHQGGFYGVAQAGTPWQCTNPMSAAGGIGPPAPTVTMSNVCGTCFGQEQTNPAIGRPNWFKDAAISQFALTGYSLLQGGSGQCVAESSASLGYDAFGNAPFNGPCIGSLFDNSYTLTITGDVAAINGSYPLAYLTTLPLAYRSAVTGPFCCNGQPLFAQFTLQAATDTHGNPSWLCSGAGGSGYADSFNCPSTPSSPDAPFIATGSFTIDNECFGSGTVFWTVS